VSIWQVSVFLLFEIQFTATTHLQIGTKFFIFGQWDLKFWNKFNKKQSITLVLYELMELDYILEKQTERNGDFHKELAPLLTFPAMRESEAKPARQRKKRI